MNFWEPFWQIVLLVSIIGFVGLVIVVAIGGLSDIRAMLRQIERRRNASSVSEKKEAKRS